MRKICRKCGRDLPLSEYYTHKAMLDGHLNICKDCVKARMINYRKENIDKVRAYDMERANTQHRKDLRYAITKKRRKEVKGYQKCHNAIAKAIRRGDIKRFPYCQVCGHICRTEAHHNDYRFPFDVVWLCSSCHSQYHIGTTHEADEIRNIVDRMFLSQRLA
jgi:hypothetical protein